MNLSRPAAQFEHASDRTLHWTLSFYIPPERLWDTGALAAGEQPAFACRYRPDAVARMQLGEPVSRALRNAVEPLFNDIADREANGAACDFILAADSSGVPGVDSDARARLACDATFHPPGAVSWQTEGRTFTASPRGLDAPRPARLRRFWFVHNNGALSWHVSFALNYDHTPGDYLFLSMLQKLAAPKEFALDDRLLEKFCSEADCGVSIFTDEPLGIGPLDDLHLAVGNAVPRRFWSCLRELFDGDAACLLERLAQAHAVPAPAAGMQLLQLAGLVEVPGLRMPRCRTLIYFNDAVFFERLSRRVDGQDEPVSRRTLIQDGCYAPYADRLATLVRRAGTRPVLLDDDPRNSDSFWNWVCDRPEYASLSDAAVAAIRAGTFEDGAAPGTKWHIPSFARGRPDCLDYLFLSGFNQNIIDFMNQDPSEILDGIDPIYPSTDIQQDEGFFIRFANHRSMITYAARSRSLEVGNDYIGTCPYAFLVHVLSLHNEFLARDFEVDTLAQLARIDEHLCGRNPQDDLGDVGTAINALKIARYRNYEQHRYINVFRYDTERDVFAELEKLRGVQRKEAALDLALASLEDHAQDLEGRRVRERDRRVAGVVFVLGLLVLADGLNRIGDFLGSKAALPQVGRILQWSSAGATLALFCAAGVLVWRNRGSLAELLGLGGNRARSRFGTDQ